MKKVAIYARLSDEDKDKKRKTDDSESIQNQKSMLISYALEKGWEIFNIYSDDDYSGGDKNRPEFKKMLEDCENGKIDIVLCKSQSRFSRELEVIEHYIHGKFIEWQIRFVSIVDNADTEIAGNKKSRQINGLINEWYLEDLSDNIRKTFKHKREKGEFVGAFAPYGYKKHPENKNKLIIDDVASNIVRAIFEMYVSGKGYRAIAIYLNKTGVPSPIEYKKLNGSNFICSLAGDKNAWNSNTICKMLQNETYIGSLVQGKRTNISYKNQKSKQIAKKDWTIIKNCHEPIIDMETWNTVSSLFRKRTRQQKNGEVHVLSRKVYCSECQKVFSKNVGKSNGNVYYYLNCKSNQKNASCENKYAIRLDYLEELIVNEINKIIKKYSDKSSIETALQDYEKLEEKTDKKKVFLEKEIEQLNKSIEDKQKLYKPMYEDKLKGIISEEEFIMLRDIFHEELETLKKRLLTIEEELEKEATKENKKLSIEVLIKKYNQVTTLNRVMVEEFINKIYIGIKNKETKEREICIEWNI